MIMSGYVVVISAVFRSYAKILRSLRISSSHEKMGKLMDTGVLHSGLCRDERSSTKL